MPEPSSDEPRTARLSSCMKLVIRSRATCFFVMIISAILTPVASFFEDVGAVGDNASLIQGWTKPFRLKDDTVINSTSTPSYFRTQRYGSNFTYSIGGFSPGKTHQISIGFAEVYVCSSGDRIFDVVVNGKVETNDLDVFKKASGCYKAHVEKYSLPANSAGKFDVQFIATKQKAFVSYIEITETTMTKAPSSRAWIDMNENESYTERHECSFVQAGNKFYYFGGRESPRRVEAYDYASNTWSVKTAVPVGEDINHFQATEYQGLVWVIGAFKSNKFPSETPSGSVLVFDPANDVWMRGSPVPQGRRRGAGGLVTYQGKFYLFGGNTNGHSGGSVSWFDEYDPQTGKWKALPDAPRGRDHFHAAVVGDRMYAVGGRQCDSKSNSSSSLGSPVKEVDVYDFTLQKWLVMNRPDDLPTPRSGAAVAVFDGKIMLMGGENRTQTKAYRQVDELDPATGKWSTLTPMHYARHGTQAIVSGQGVYVIAGSPVQREGKQKKMEVFNKNSPTGVASTTGVLFAPSGVEAQSGIPSSVTIRHVGGNEGVFVQSITLTGAAKSNFQYLLSDRLLIAKNGLIILSVTYTGLVDGAEAQFVLSYSGGKTLSISIVGKAETVKVGNNTLPQFPPPALREFFFANAGSSRENIHYVTGKSVRNDKSASVPDYFRSYRWSSSPFGYKIDGFNSSKTYEIMLGFAEIDKDFCMPGKRVFDITVNGFVKTTGLDVYKVAGCETPYLITYKLSPNSGTFNIEFVPRVGNPMVSLVDIRTGTSPPPPPPSPPPSRPPSRPPSPPSSNSLAILHGTFTTPTEIFTTTDNISSTPTPDYFRSYHFSKYMVYLVEGLTPLSTHDVSFGFAEIWGPNCATGKRVFDILVNGALVKSNLDVYAAAGCRTAHVETLTLTADASGRFKIEFKSSVDSAMISFITSRNF